MATSFLKPHTAAEIETLLASEPESTAPQSCVQLCARIDNDFDIIDNLEDFPQASAPPFAPLPLQTSATLTRR